MNTLKVERNVNSIVISLNGESITLDAAEALSLEIEIARKVKGIIADSISSLDREIRRESSGGGSHRICRAVQIELADPPF